MGGKEWPAILTTGFRMGGKELPAILTTEFRMSGTELPARMGQPLYYVIPSVAEESEMPDLTSFQDF